MGLVGLERMEKVKRVVEWRMEVSEKWVQWQWEVMTSMVQDMEGVE